MNATFPMNPTQTPVTAPAVSYTTGTNPARQAKKVTRYQDAIVEDIQYGSVDEAIIAGAKAHTTRELNSAIQLVNEDLGLEMNVKDIKQAIYNRKKLQIVESMSRRADVNDFDDIQL